MSNLLGGLFQPKETLVAHNTAPTQPKPYLNPVEAMFEQMNPKERRAYIREYARQCRKYPAHMKAEALPEDMIGAVLGAWRSDRFYAVAYPSSYPIVLCRLTVNRVEVNERGSWLSGISWDDLYRIKNECGYGDYDAVEVFPKEANLINVANMRHLWVMAHPLPFGLQS
jgi:hypothetical protein